MWTLSLDRDSTINLHDYIIPKTGWKLSSMAQGRKILSNFDRKNFEVPSSNSERFEMIIVTAEESFRTLKVSLDLEDEVTNLATNQLTMTYRVQKKEGESVDIVYPSAFYQSSCFSPLEWSVNDRDFNQEGFDPADEIPTIILDDDYEVKLKLTKKNFKITIQVDPDRLYFDSQLSSERSLESISVSAKGTENDSGEYKIENFEITEKSNGDPITCDDSFELKIESSAERFGFEGDYEIEGDAKIDTRGSDEPNGIIKFRVESDITITISYVEYYFAHIIAKDSNLSSLIYYGENYELDLWVGIRPGEKFNPYGGGSKEIDFNEFTKRHPDITIQDNTQTAQEEATNFPVMYSFRLSSKKNSLKIKPVLVNTDNLLEFKDGLQSKFYAAGLARLSEDRLELLNGVPATMEDPIVSKDEDSNIITINAFPGAGDEWFEILAEGKYKSNLKLKISNEGCIGDDCGEIIDLPNDEYGTTSEPLELNYFDSVDAPGATKNLIEFIPNSSYEFINWEVDNNVNYVVRVNWLGLMFENETRFSIWSPPITISESISDPSYLDFLGEYSSSPGYEPNKEFKNKSSYNYSYNRLTARVGEVITFSTSDSRNLFFGGTEKPNVLELVNKNPAIQVWSVNSSNDTLMERLSIDEDNTGVDVFTVTNLGIEQYALAILVTDDNRLKLTQGESVSNAALKISSLKIKEPFNLVSKIHIYENNLIIKSKDASQTLIFDKKQTNFIANVKLKTSHIKVTSSHPNRGRVKASLLSSLGDIPGFENIVNDAGETIGVELKNATAKHIFNIEALQNSGKAVFVNWEILPEETAMDFVNFSDNQDNFNQLRRENFLLSTVSDIELRANFTPRYELIVIPDVTTSTSTMGYLEAEIFNPPEDTKRPYFSEKTLKTRLAAKGNNLINAFVKTGSQEVSVIDAFPKYQAVHITAIENYRFELFTYREFIDFGQEETNLQFKVDNNILHISNYRFLYFYGYGMSSLQNPERLEGIDASITELEDEGFKLSTADNFTDFNNVNGSKITITNDSYVFARFSDVFLVEDTSVNGSIVFEPILESDQNIIESDVLEDSYWILPSDVSSVLEYEEKRNSRASSRDVESYLKSRDGSELEWAFAGFKIKTRADAGWVFDKWQVPKGSPLIYNINEFDKKQEEEEVNIILCHQAQEGLDQSHKTVIRATFVRLLNLTLTADPAHMGEVIGSGSYKQTASISIEAKPKALEDSSGVPYDAYVFNGWEEVLERGEDSGLRFGDAGDLEIKDSIFIDGDTILKALFAYKEYDFSTKLSTIEEYQGGIIDVAETTPDGKYNVDNQIKVQATPGLGYVFYKWEVVSGRKPDGFDETNAAQTFKLQGSFSIEARFATVNTLTFLIADGDNPDDQQYITDPSIAYVEQGQVIQSIAELKNDRKVLDYLDYVTLVEERSKTYNGKQDVVARLNLVNTDLYYISKWEISGTGTGDEKVFIVEKPDRYTTAGINLFNKKYKNNRPLYFNITTNTIVTVYLDKANLLKITTDGGVDSSSVNQLDLLNDDGEFKYYNSSPLWPSQNEETFNEVNKAWIDFEVFWPDIIINEDYEIDEINIKSGTLYAIKDIKLYQTGRNEKLNALKYEYIAIGGQERPGVILTSDIVDQTEYPEGFTLTENNARSDRSRISGGLDNLIDGTHFPFHLQEGFYIKEDTEIEIKTKLKEHKLTIIWAGAALKTPDDLLGDPSELTDWFKDKTLSMDVDDPCQGYGIIDIAITDLGLTNSLKKVSSSDSSKRELSSTTNKEQVINLKAQEALSTNSLWEDGDYSVNNRFHSWELVEGELVEDLDVDNSEINIKLKKDTVIVVRFERFFEINVRNTTGNPGVEIEGNRRYGELEFYPDDISPVNTPRKWFNELSGSVEVSASSTSSDEKSFGGWVFNSSQIGIDEGNIGGALTDLITSRSIKPTLRTSSEDEPEYSGLAVWFANKVTNLDISYINAFTVEILWNIRDETTSVNNADLNLLFKEYGGYQGYDGNGSPAVVYTGDSLNQDSASTFLSIPEGQDFYITAGNHDGKMPFEFINWSISTGKIDGTNSRKNKLGPFTADKNYKFVANFSAHSTNIVVWPVFNFPTINEEIERPIFEDKEYNEEWEYINDDIDFLLPGQLSLYQSSFISRYKKEYQNSKATIGASDIIYSKKLIGLKAKSWSQGNQNYYTRILTQERLWNKFKDILESNTSVRNKYVSKRTGGIYIYNTFIQGYGRSSSTTYGVDIKGITIHSPPKGIEPIEARYDQFNQDGLLKYNKDVWELNSGVKIDFSTSSGPDAVIEKINYHFNFLDFGKNSTLKDISFLEQGLVFVDYERKKYKLRIHTNDTAKGYISKVIDNVSQVNGEYTYTPEKTILTGNWSEEIEFYAKAKVGSDYEKIVPPQDRGGVGAYVVPKPGNIETVKLLGFKTENTENLSNEDLDQMLNKASVINFSTTKGGLIKSGGDHKLEWILGAEIDNEIEDYDYFIIDITYQRVKSSVSPSNGYSRGDNQTPGRYTHSYEESTTSLWGASCSGWPTFYFKSVDMSGPRIEEHEDLSKEKGRKYIWLDKIYSPCKKKNDKQVGRLLYNYISDNPHNDQILGMFGGRPLLNYYGDRIIVSGARYVKGYKSTKQWFYDSENEAPLKYLNGNDSKQDQIPNLDLVVYQKYGDPVNKPVTLHTKTIIPNSDIVGPPEGTMNLGIGDKIILDQAKEGAESWHLIPNGLPGAGDNATIPAHSWIPRWNHREFTDWQIGNKESYYDSGKGGEIYFNRPLRQLLKGAWAESVNKRSSPIYTEPNTRKVEYFTGSLQSLEGVDYYGSNSDQAYKGFKMYIPWEINSHKINTSNSANLRNTSSQTSSLSRLYGIQFGSTNRAGGRAKTTYTTIEAPDYRRQYPLYLPTFLAIDADGWNFKWYDTPNSSSGNQSYPVEGGFGSPGVINSRMMDGKEFEWDEACFSPTYRDENRNDLNLLANSYYRGYKRERGYPNQLWPGYDKSMSKWLCSSYRFKWKSYKYDTWDASLSTGDFIDINYGHIDQFSRKTSWPWYYGELDIEGKPIEKCPLLVTPSPWMTGPINGLDLYNQLIPDSLADIPMLETLGCITEIPKNTTHYVNSSNRCKSKSADPTYSYGGVPYRYTLQYSDNVEARSIAAQTDWINESVHIKKITGKTILSLKSLIPIQNIEGFGISVTHKKLITSYTMNLYRDRKTGSVYGDKLFAPFSGTVPYAYMSSPYFREGVQGTRPQSWPTYWDHVTDKPDLKNAVGSKYSLFQDQKKDYHGFLEKRIGLPQRKYEVLMVRSHEHLHVFVKIPFESDFIHCCDRYVGIAKKDQEVFLDHSATGNVHWITNQKLEDGAKNACFSRPGTAPMDAAVFYDDDNITPVLRIAYRTVENDSLAGHSFDYEPKLGSTVTSNLNDKEYEVVEKDYSIYDESARRDGSYNVLGSRWYRIKSKQPTTPSGPYTIPDHWRNDKDIPLSDMLTVKDEYIITHIEGHEENRDIVVVEDISLPKTYTRRNENTGLKNPTQNFDAENKELVQDWKDDLSLRGSHHPDFNFTNSLFPVNVVKQLYDLKYPIHSFGRHISLSGDGMTISIMADQRKYYMKDQMVEGASELIQSKYKIPKMTKELNVYNVDGQLRQDYLNESVDELVTKALLGRAGVSYLPQGKAIVLTDDMHIPETTINKDNPLLFQFKNDTYTYEPRELIPVEDSLPTDDRPMSKLSEVYHDLTKDHWRYRRIFQRFMTYSLR